MVVIHIVCIICILAMLITIIRLCKMNRELDDKYTSSFIYFTTFKEFIPCIAEHISKEEILNDMTNAVKICTNKALYSIKNVDTDDNQCYEEFAQAILYKIMNMDKE